MTQPCSITQGWLCPNLTQHITDCAVFISAAFSMFHTNDWNHKTFRLLLTRLAIIVKIYPYTHYHCLVRLHSIAFRIILYPKEDQGCQFYWFETALERPPSQEMYCCHVIKLPRYKAAAYTRSGCRFMFQLKQNEQCQSYLGFWGNEPFHHIDFPKHLEKSFVSRGIWVWLWRIYPQYGPVAWIGFW